MKCLLLTVIVSISVVILPSPSSAVEVIVDLKGTGDFTEIQPAIDAAREGDLVLVKPGEYLITEPIVFRGKAITVRGELGAGETTIRMSENPADCARASVVVLDSGETRSSLLEGLTLAGGQGSGGLAGSECCGHSCPWELSVVYC